MVTTYAVSTGDLNDLWSTAEGSPVVDRVLEVAGERTTSVVRIDGVEAVVLVGTVACVRRTVEAVVRSWNQAGGRWARAWVRCGDGWRPVRPGDTTRPDGSAARRGRNRSTNAGEFSDSSDRHETP